MAIKVCIKCDGYMYLVSHEVIDEWVLLLTILVLHELQDAAKVLPMLQ